MAVKIAWYGHRVEDKTKKQIERGMHVAMRFVEGEVKKLLKVGQPTRRTAHGRVGLNPSREGEPPHVLTGRLRQSITYEVESRRYSVHGRVGTNVVYARRLELGFTGTDSRGRRYHQGQRPFLRPAIQMNKSKIINRIMGGKL